MSVTPRASSCGKRASNLRSLLPAIGCSRSSLMTVKPCRAAPQPPLDRLSSTVVNCEHTPWDQHHMADRSGQHLAKEVMLVDHAASVRLLTRRQGAPVCRASAAAKVDPERRTVGLIRTRRCSWAGSGPAAAMRSV